MSIPVVGMRLDAVVSQIVGKVLRPLESDTVIA